MTEDLAGTGDDGAENDRAQGNEPMRQLTTAVALVAALAAWAPQARAGESLQTRAPAGLRAAAGTGGVTLSWQDVADGEAGYVIERGSRGGAAPSLAFSTVATVTNPASQKTPPTIPAPATSECHNQVRSAITRSLDSRLYQKSRLHAAAVAIRLTGCS